METVKPTNEHTFPPLRALLLIQRRQRQEKRKMSNICICTAHLCLAICSSLCIMFVLWDLTQQQPRLGNGMELKWKYCSAQVVPSNVCLSLYVHSYVTHTLHILGIWWKLYEKRCMEWYGEWIKRDSRTGEWRINMLRNKKRI